jgi:hypothetical protein
VNPCPRILDSDLEAGNSLGNGLAPTNALSVQHEKRAGNGATGALAESYFSSGVGSEACWARLLVGFRCEDTCHMARSDWTCPWNLVGDLPLASLLEELAAGRDVGPELDPTTLLAQHLGSVV